MPVTTDGSITKRTRGSGRASIRDVARDAGVSVATVSRTLANDGYPVSEATRRKVLASVAKLRFVPNDMARSLSQDRTNTIGIIVPNVVNLYYAHVVIGVEEVAAENGLATIFCNTSSSLQKLETDIAVLQQKRVDGIILCGSASNLAANSPIRRTLEGFPLVVVGRNDTLDCPSIHADNQKAGNQAAEHLIALGHRRFAFLSGPRYWTDGEDRIQGFRAALASHSIPPDHLVLTRSPLTERDAYQQMRSIDPARVTAVVGGNDRMAVGAMAAVIDMGRSVPSEVAVLGFDNIATGTFMRPSLTTMDVPARDMGAEAMRLVLKLRAGTPVPSRTVFDAPLLVRGSTVPGVPALL